MSDSYDYVMLWLQILLCCDYEYCYDYSNDCYDDYNNCYYDFNDCYDNTPLVLVGAVEEEKPGENNYQRKKPKKKKNR